MLGRLHIICIFGSGFGEVDEIMLILDWTPFYDVEYSNLQNIRITAKSLQEYPRVANSTVVPA